MKENTTMTETVRDVPLARLREWSIKQVFAFPGQWHQRGRWPRGGGLAIHPQFVQARHEEMAAFEAVWATFNFPSLSRCARRPVAGGDPLLNGVYDAKLDDVPVVAIVGQTDRSAMGGLDQQEVDLLTLFEDVCSDYVQMCTVPQQLPKSHRLGAPRSPCRARPRQPA